MQSKELLLAVETMTLYTLPVIKRTKNGPKDKPFQESK